MAKKPSQWGNMRPGRKSAHTFDALVSPLGEDCTQHNDYSPAEPVEGADTGTDPASHEDSESARNERRGG